MKTEPNGYGLDERGIFNAPVQWHIPLPARSRASVCVRLAQTAAAGWVYGYSMGFKLHHELRQCLALNEQYPTRRRAEAAALIEIVQRLREWSGSQKVRLVLLERARQLSP